MSLKIEKIFLSNETSTTLSDSIDLDVPAGEQTDVLVLCENGDTYAAVFVTPIHIKKSMQEDEKRGLRLSGRYFWIKNMLVINKCERVEIELVVKDLLEEGDFLTVFEKL